MHQHLSVRGRLNRNRFRRNFALPQAHGSRSLRTQSPTRGRPALRAPEEWKSWPEITVVVTGLPFFATALNLHELLQQEGQISRVDLAKDQEGNRLDKAFVTFAPPPTRAFWDLSEEWAARLKDDPKTSYPIHIYMQPPKRTFLQPSPIDPSKYYPERLDIRLEQIDFGYMCQVEEMMVMHSVRDLASSRARLTLNLLRRELEIEFSITITATDQDPVPDRIKFQVPIHQMDSFLEPRPGNSEQTIVFSLDHAPNFYRRVHHIIPTFKESNHWNERFLWTRMTEIRHRDYRVEERLQRGPLRLKRADDEIINIGHWTTYRISFELQNSNTKAYEQMKQALGDYNIKFKESNNFSIRSADTANISVWELIDAPKDLRFESFLDEMLSNTFQLSWPVRYQLEGCISHGILDEHNIPREFLKRLTNLPEIEAISRLEVAADRGKRCFDPFEVFELPLARLKPYDRIPDHCIVQRSAVVTPTTIYYQTPTVEMSNRVLRYYSKYTDRFLRVRFTEEKFEGRLQPTEDDTLDAVYNKIYNCLTRGIVIGDRHFEFVAMGNSQFREHGAYFFASSPNLTAAQIRAKLGDIGRMLEGEFIPEAIVAKYASRLGQCFSTTRPIRISTVKIVEISDVKRNGYVFTDGVGKISPFLAKLISLELELTYVPSLFQFRMGGIKGVVAVSPLVKDNEVHIRESQYKFAAVYQGLEIIRCSNYKMPRLNRQLITVLSSLGVPDRVFIGKLSQELSGLDMVMSMEDECYSQALLRKHIDYNQMTLVVANIMADGFMQMRDPFAISVLHLWRAWAMKQLKEKSALSIPNGAFVLGCTDETGCLRGYFSNVMPLGEASREEKVDALPQIFVQITDPDKPNIPGRPPTSKIITGICIVARNPSLHPGDVRVVRAVDVPSLHHLKDVVVFPQTGDRDVPNMCSGGDLDGDDFLVIWDQDLIPPESEWDLPAMDFTPPTPQKKDGKVDALDIIKFFIMYMKSDTLRSIARAHLANADCLAGGIRHPRCLKLANMHSVAVDYPKSGVPAGPIRGLRPHMYPHFMATRHRSKDKCYHSTTVLGQLYDQVPVADFLPIMDLPFDERVLGAFQLDSDTYESAALVKLEYDAAIRRIMAQHEIATEFEVWTTFIMQHSRYSNDYKFHEEIGQLSADLKNRFVEICRAKAGGREYEKIAPFVAAMYTVTADEVRIASARVKKDSWEEQFGLSSPDRLDPPEVPLISFPWLFPKELGKIAQGPRATLAKKADDSSTFVPAERNLGTSKKKYPQTELHGPDYEMQDRAGFVCRGDILELFQHETPETGAEDEGKNDGQDQAMEDVGPMIASAEEDLIILDYDEGEEGEIYEETRTLISLL